MDTIQPEHEGATTHTCLRFSGGRSGQTIWTSFLVSFFSHSQSSAWFTLTFPVTVTIPVTTSPTHFSTPANPKFQGKRPRESLIPKRRKRLGVPLKLPMESIAFWKSRTHPLHRHRVSAWRLNRLYRAPTCKEPRLSSQVR